MILADTNILINYWKTPTEKVKRFFEKNEIATCGVIKTEILRGSRSAKEFGNLEKALDCFEYLDFDRKDWICFAEYLIKLKESGITIPMQDGIIAYLAIKNNCKLWTNDKHFLLIQSVFPNLSLL